LLGGIFSPRKLVWILTQSSSVARAKCCNLIGNLCRHSGKFYTVLSTRVEISRNAGSPSRRSASTTVLDILSRACADADPSTRKFASFAIGNAAFHSRELYPALAGSVQPLATSLRDVDEKTRANAAGAIGNLIRNGGELSGMMADLHIVDMLLQMLLRDEDITPQRIALFSLGTMAVYPATRAAILSARPSINDTILRVKESHASDEMVQKYLLRLRQKLKSAPQAT
jgi:fused-like protein